MAPSQETLTAECHPSVVGTPRVIDDSTPDLFRPLKIRSLSLRNRICVSPMCLYSTAAHGPQQGVLTPLYITTIGHNVFKGAALAMLEATGVQPNGRISPHCPGLWNSTQQQALKTLTDFIHSQGGLCGVQLSHAGRKASTLPPLAAARLGKSSARATVEDGGWPDDVVGPSCGLSWDGKTNDDPAGGFYVPREITKQEIEQLISNYASAAERAVDAGVDVVEIHAAHGYLIHQFLSPLTNRRNDEYGGGFDNRVRLLLEVIRAVRGRVPATTPVFVRISVTDWMEDTRLGSELGTWDEESTVRLVTMLPALGVDLVDISSGGNHPLAHLNVFDGGEKHTAIARRLKQSLVSQGVSMLVGTVGMITRAEQARDLVQGGEHGQPGVDIVSIGRQFLRQPDWVLNAAAEIGVDVVWPAQIERLRPGPTARI